MRSSVVARFRGDFDITVVTTSGQADTARPAYRAHLCSAGSGSLAQRGDLGNFGDLRELRYTSL